MPNETKLSRWMDLWRHRFYATLPQVGDNRSRGLKMSRVAVGWWMPNTEFKEWDYCSVCKIGTKRREYGTEDDGTPWFREEGYTYCPWCGARLYDYKKYNYTIDSESGTVSVKNGQNQF